MAKVLIVSKTQMANGICIGGINEDNCELIRLHNERGGNLSADAPYEIGERWQINVEDAWNARPIPHIEDKQTSPVRKIENVGINGIVHFINSHNFGQRLTRGALSQTFCGCLHLEGSKNYINTKNVPPFSTQFWIADRDLVHCFQFNKHYYLYNGIRIKFVGYQVQKNEYPLGQSYVYLLPIGGMATVAEKEDAIYNYLDGIYSTIHVKYIYGLSLSFFIYHYLSYICYIFATLVYNLLIVRRC